MSKFNDKVCKKINKVRRAALMEMKKIIAAEGAVVMESDAWNKPDETDFCSFKDDGSGYVEYMTVSPVDESILDIDYGFATREELKEFQTVTYPKLYAEWKKTQQGAKLRKRQLVEEIKRLQDELSEIESEDDEDL